MTIDLSNPIVIGVSISIISATILGIVHYAITLVNLKVTDKKLSNVLSELDALHKDYKKAISDINKRHGSQLEESLKLTKDAIALYEKKMDNFLEHNKPPLGLLSKPMYVNTSEPWKQ